MSRLILLCALCAFSFTAFSQKSISSIELTPKYELKINGNEINKKTSLAELEEIIGKAEREVEYQGGEVSYFYDEDGVVINTLNGKFQGLGTNYHWDGDEKFPETTYTGKLKLAEGTLNKHSVKQDIEQIKGIPFICALPMMCASSDRSAPVKCLVGFDEGKITQIAMILK